MVYLRHRIDGCDGSNPDRYCARGIGDPVQGNTNILARAAMVASTLSDSVEARDDCPELSGSHARDSMNVPATSHEPQIEVSGLVVSYGDTVAVNNISFTVERGENLTLLGPSGCGKTTTLRAIAGLEQPSSGLIRIDGKPMYSAAEGVNLATEKRGLSMVFQSYGVWPHM